MFAADAPTTARIAAVRNSLQPAEARVADLIVGEPETVVELTAQELADRIGVGRSTVVRACQTFGYKGYPQLRVALASELARQTRAGESDYGSGRLGGIREAIDRMALDLRAAASLLSEKDVEAAVATVGSARRLLVVANGLSAPLASDLAMRLTAAGRPAETVGDTIAQQIAARQLSPEDACVVVSGSGANEASLRAAASARRAGARVVAITSFASSPLTEQADIALVIAPAGASFRDELVHTSRVAHTVFVEAFVDAVARSLPDDAQSVRATVLEILSENLGDTP